jgi:hypothetical protein
LTSKLPSTIYWNTSFDNIFQYLFFCLILGQDSEQSGTFDDQCLHALMGRDSRNRCSGSFNLLAVASCWAHVEGTNMLRMSLQV